MKRRIILYMTINYIFSLGTCSANKITYDPLNKNFKNSLPCGKIRLWIGEGDICLCADEERRIVGLSGNLDTVADITDDAIVLPTVTDGVVTAELGIKSFEGIIVSIECCGERRYIHRFDRMYRRSPQRRTHRLRRCRRRYFCQGFAESLHIFARRKVMRNSCDRLS